MKVSILNTVGHHRAFSDVSNFPFRGPSYKALCTQGFDSRESSYPPSVSPLFFSPVNYCRREIPAAVPPNAATGIVNAIGVEAAGMVGGGRRRYKVAPLMRCRENGYLSTSIPTF